MVMKGNFVPTPRALSRSSCGRFRCSRQGFLTSGA